jgi:LysR family transcriptional regulator, low CO2-responsive transcriptional regulator
MDFLSPPLLGFLQIVRTGSVTRAAHALGLTQPAVTKQIRALEAALDTPLVERQGRGVRLTRAGELLADAAQRSAAVFEDYLLAVGDLQQGKSGKLVIGAGVTTCVQLLPAWLREFRRRHPAIDVSVRTGTSRAVEDWVASAEVDFGFVTSEPRRQELLSRRLFEEEIVLVVEPAAASAEPVPLEQLGLILFPKATGFRQYLDQRLGARLRAGKVKMETDSIEAIKSFVAVGLGASFLPISTVQDELSRGTLARVEPRGVGKLRRSTAVIRRPGTPSLAIRSFLDIVSSAPAPALRAVQIGMEPPAKGAAAAKGMAPGKPRRRKR